MNVSVAVPPRLPGGRRQATPSTHPTSEADRHDQHLQNTIHLPWLPGGPAVADEQIVAMAHITESAKRGLPTRLSDQPLRVMATMFDANMPPRRSRRVAQAWLGRAQAWQG
jgi:hypothetical protein